MDTYKSQVARHALESGALMVNDVWGLKPMRRLQRWRRSSEPPLVIMHNQKTRKYRDLLPDIVGSLSRSIAIARQSGVADEQIIIDPGIGFGKTAEHNLQVLRNLSEFRRLGIQFLSALRASPLSVSCWASRKISDWKAPPPRWLCPLPVAPT